MATIWAVVVLGAISTRAILPGVERPAYVPAGAVTNNTLPDIHILPDAAGDCRDHDGRAGIRLPSDADVELHFCLRVTFCRGVGCS